MIAKGEMLRSLVSNLPRRKSRSLENLYMDIAGLRAKGKMEWGIYSNKFQRRSTLICYDSGCSLKDQMRVELFKQRTLRFKYRGLKSSRCFFFCGLSKHWIHFHDFCSTSLPRSNDWNSAAIWEFGRTSWVEELVPWKHACTARSYNHNRRG